MKRLLALAFFALAAADAPEAPIPAEFGLVEGIAWDARSRQLYASGVEDGALLVREGNRWRRTVLPWRPAGLFGLAIDPRRGILWMASGIAGPTRDKAGFRGLIGVSTLGLEPVAKVGLPAGDAQAQPGDVAVAPDGSVYVSDGATGGIYVCKPECDVLEPLVAKGRFRSAQGLAAMRDGRTLYVADYGRGLFRIDLKKPAKITEVLPLKGIDGLVRDGEALIAIINGDGRKVVRISFDAEGRPSQQLLDMPEGPGDPTLGTLIDRRLVYVADAQWDRFDASGKGLTPPRVTTLRTIALPAIPATPRARSKR